MSKQKGELFRNTQERRIAGICAGIADYLGWEAWLVRILVVSAVLFGMPFVIFGYMAAWLILDKKPKAENLSSFDRRSNESAYGTQGGTPHNTNASADGYQRDMSNESIKVKARIWQSGEPPKQALYDISRKFSSLEKRLQAVEQYVTSPEFTVAREINKL